MARSVYNEPDYTSAAMGKYSECMFHLPQSNDMGPSSSGQSSLHTNGSSTQSLGSFSKKHIGSRPLYSRSLSNNLSFGQSSPFMRHRRCQSSAGSTDDGKRLVYQFLNVDEDEKDNEAGNFSRRSTASFIYPSTHDCNLPHLVYCDLKNSLSSLNEKNRNPEELPPSESGSYDQYIADELAKFEACIRDTMMCVLIGKESTMKDNFKQLESLEDDVHHMKSAIQEIKTEFEQTDMYNIRYAFNKEDENSFIRKLTRAISEHLESLGSLEQRISNCKEELGKQKEALQKLETTVRLNEMLQDSQSNRKFCDKMKEHVGIISDAVALIMVIIVIIFCRAYFRRFNV